MCIRDRCGETAVALVVVIYRSALSGTVIVRRIILNIGKCETSRVQCRCIGSDNLKGGTLSLIHLSRASRMLLLSRQEALEQHLKPEAIPHGIVHHRHS